MATVNLAKLRELEAQGYLTGRNHPRLSLIIWNYTPKTQFEKHWTPETLMCRGLITNFKGKIIARPFPKFFHMEEHQGPIPDEPFEVYEKYDGSLGILYWMNGKPMLATRGSFISEQAIEGTRILSLMMKTYRWRVDDFDKEVTYLFEIIYPKNRIVVDYGDEEKIILLAMVHTASGWEYPLNISLCPADLVAKRYDSVTDLSEIKRLGRENQEGFVVRFTKSNLRLKIKLDDYVRLHRILTGIHARHIWEYLSEGKSLDELLDRVPDEFFNWVKQTDAQLRLQFNEIEQEAMFWTIRALRFKTRKEQAKFIAIFENKHIVFKMLDGKPYEEAIWKLIKPAADRPFRQEEVA